MESVKITCRILLMTTLVSLFCLAVVGCKEASAPKSGEVAPAISCNDVTGEYFSLNQLKNNVVVIYFWSSKCCSDKVIELEPFYLQNKDKGLSIVAIEVGSSKESVTLFAKNNHLTFTNLVDDFDSLSRSYQVIGFPTIFLVDKKGVIQKKISGPIQINQLNKLVSALL